MSALDASASPAADTNSAVDRGDDIVAFVVGDDRHMLYFSKSALMRHTPFFRAYFTENASKAATTSGGGSGGTTVMLRHVKPLSAEAVLRLCHSAHHSDDELFWSLQRECQKADAAHKPEALRAALSLYAACVKFELHEHAKAASGTVAGAVTENTVYDVLKTCARYATALLPEARQAVGLDAVLAACSAFVQIRGSGHGGRRWHRLYEQYPTLSEILAAASVASTKSNAHGESSAIAAAGDSPPPLRRVLLSPQKDLSTTAPSATAMPRSHAPLPDVFASYLRQTEGLALAAQWRCRAMSAEVTALRESCAALEATAQRDEAAAVEATLYLSEVRVYMQALRQAEVELQQLCAAAAVTCGASSSAADVSTLHELRHTLQRASAFATERKAAIDELLAMEKDAVDALDVELARLRAPIC
ncbi:hypothetical protein, unknown function [Leishmania tarentolae]|uniref:Uncharacterized protein n=1 Tax=Leishmania tarentolae TaxID=5689 RepID=A0A640KFB5_LEITA|nr:hypothetical protein, unknown function [Leishmania tarentolae]